MTAQSGRSYSTAAVMGRDARTRLIALTHELPDDMPDDIPRLWNEADNALVAFLRRVEEERDRGATG